MGCEQRHLLIIKHLTLRIEFGVSRPCVIIRALLVLRHNRKPWSESQLGL